MSRAREMLAAAPGDVELGLDEVAAAIDACLECLQSCTTCADADVNEEDVVAMRRCIGLCVDCADVCYATLRVLSRSVSYDKLLVQRQLTACVRACSSCAEECGRHAAHHEHCRICAEVCGACEKACRVLLDTEALEELQALAGG